MGVTSVCGRKKRTRTTNKTTNKKVVHILELHQESVFTTKQHLHLIIIPNEHHDDFVMSLKVKEMKTKYLCLTSVMVESRDERTELCLKIRPIRSEMIFRKPTDL